MPETMIFRRMSVRGRIGPVERACIAGTLLGLLAVGTWVALRGRQVNPDLFRLRESAVATASKEQTVYRRPVTRFTAVPEGGGVSSLLTPGLLGATFRREDAVRVFGPDNLFEKIDGRESLYKSYGFKRLWTASYAAVSPPAARMEIEIFLQGGPMEAFGVLSAERQGATGPPARVEPPNGLFLTRGPYYVRLVGSEASERVRHSAAAAAATLSALSGSVVEPAMPLPVVSASAAATDPAASALPPEHWTLTNNPLVTLGAEPASLRYQAVDALGMEVFKGVYLGTVREGSSSVIAFVFPARTAAEADAAFRQYSVFLTRGTAKSEASGFPGFPPRSVAVKDPLLRTWEWAFSSGRFVAGVTEAADGLAAARLVIRLERALRGGR